MRRSQSINPLHVDGLSRWFLVSNDRCSGSFLLYEGSPFATKNLAVPYGELCKTTVRSKTVPSPTGDHYITLAAAKESSLPVETFANPTLRRECTLSPRRLSQECIAQCRLALRQAQGERKRQIPFLLSAARSPCRSTILLIESTYETSTQGEGDTLAFQTQGYARVS